MKIESLVSEMISWDSQVPDARRLKSVKEEKGSQDPSEELEPYLVES